MATLREMESLKLVIENQKEEIKFLKQEILEIKSLMNEFIKNDKISINKLSSKDNDDLSIIFTKYKQSLIVKNKYLDKNTTIKCKNELKELGAKWFKNESVQGWIFVGLCKDSEKSLEEQCEFIVKKLNDKKFKLEIEYK